MISFVDIAHQVFSESNKHNTSENDDIMYSESEVLSAYEEAVYMASALPNTLHAISKTSMMFAESMGGKTNPTVELYIASAFDKVKGFITGVIEAIIKALKTAWNYLSKLGNNFVKLFMKNFGDLEKKIKTFKELVASRKDLKEIKFRRDIDTKVKGVYEGALLRFLLSCVAFWQSDVADVFPLNANTLNDKRRITANKFYNEIVGVDINKVIKNLRAGNTSEGVAAAYPNNAIQKVAEVSNYLRGAKCGYSGEGNLKIEQQCYFLNLILNDAQKYISDMIEAALLGPLTHPKHVSPAAMNPNHFSMYNLFTGNDVNTGLTAEEKEKIKFAKRLKGDNELSLSLLNTKYIHGIVSGTFTNSKNDGIRDAVAAGTREILADIYRMIVPNGKKDLKTDVVNIMYAKEYYVTDIKVDDAWYLTLMLCYGCNAYNIINHRLKMDQVKDNIKNGADFFRKSVKTFETIYKDMVETVKLQETDTDAVKDVIQRVSASTVEIAKITSWFTTGMIQLYSISDKLTFKGIAESIKEIDTCTMLMTTSMTDVITKTI